MLARPARLWPRRCGTRSGSPSSAGTAPATPPRQRRGHPAGDAGRAPDPRHGGASAGGSRRRRRSPWSAERSGRTYDPGLAELFVTHGAGWFDRLAELEPWDSRARAEPAPHRTLSGEALDDALTVVADFIDLKSPFMSGHSRRCAELAAGARPGARARRPGRRPAPPRGTGARARHDRGAELDLGQAGPADPGRVRPGGAPPDAHRADAAALPGAAALNPVAAGHHERTDGSGYHKRLRRPALDPGAAVLAATDVYVGLTSDRADRPALPPARGRRRAASAPGRSGRCSTRRPPRPCSPRPGTTPRAPAARAGRAIRAG